MILKKIQLWGAISFFLMAGTALAADQWTGFYFRNGMDSNLEQSGPFNTKRECFEWAKSKMVNPGDKYRCGEGCEKDGNGELQCQGFEVAESGSGSSGEAKLTSAGASPAAVSKSRVLVG